MAEGIGLLDGDPARLLDALLSTISETVLRIRRDGLLTGLWSGAGSGVPPDGLELLRSLADQIGTVRAAELVPPEVADSALATIAEALDRSKVVTLTYAYLREGRSLHLQARCYPYSEDEVLWVARDITPEVEGMRLLAAHEARFESVVEAIDVAVTLHGANGDLVSFNRAAASLYAIDDPAGTGRARLVTMPRAVDAEGNPLPFDQWPVMRTLATGEPCTDVVMGLARDGVVERWLRTSTKLLVASGVEDPLVLATAVDITALRAAERLAGGRLELESLLSDVSERLLSAPEHTLDREIDESLERVAGFFGADVSFICEFRGAGVLEVVRQWRGPDAGPVAERSNRTRSGEFRFAEKALAGAPVFFVRDLEALPGAGATERGHMARRRDKSVAWIRIGPPLEQAGIIGLSWKARRHDGPEAYLAGLVRVGEAILGALSRRDAERLASGQRHVLETIARGESLSVALSEVATLRESRRPTVRSAVLLVEDGSDTMEVVAAPSMTIGLRAAVQARRLAAFGETVASSAGGGSVAIESLTEHHDPQVRDLGESLSEAGVGSLSATSLVSAHTGRVIGLLLALDLDLDHRPLEDPDLDEACAALASVAIERAADVAELSHQATHDPLTGSANRLALLDRLELALLRAKEHGQFVAVLFCDLDRFKEVNDRLGHEVGDALLREVATRISAVVGPTDTVSRFGGDEFVVLIDEVVDESHALRVADDVAAAVHERPFMLNGTPVTMTTSIGVAISAAGADHPEAMVRDADVAMYRAKASGRARREVFHESIRRAARDRDELARDLRLALEHGELEVHYQPLVSIDMGHVEGLEALVRWRHPERGIVTPDSFIPIAEETGLIVELGRWVTDEAVHQLAKLAAGDHRWAGLRMHVNLSARQLAEAGFVDDLHSSLETWDIPAKQVVLEITESVLMADSASTRDSIEALSSLGSQLVLDDFGTGYASLTYLRRFPVRGLKVDRSFVAGLGLRAEDDAIVRAVVQLARSLDLSVVAEGVETAEQVRFLKEIGCAGAQGYFYGRPSPATAIGDLLDTLGV